MVCMELQYENKSEDEVVYGDQEISAEEYEKATYGNLTKTQSKEEEEIKCTVAQQANDSMILERKRRQLNENNPDKKQDGDSQSDAPLNEKSTVNSITNRHQRYKAQRMMITKTSREKRGQWRC